jgi:hypothetical protein
MQRRARIRISGDRRALQDQWNSLHPDNPMIAGAVEVDSGTLDYLDLKGMYSNFSALQTMTWDESSEVIYEEEDLEQFAILTLWISGRAGAGGNVYGSVYDEIRKCPACGTENVGRQTGPIVLDPSEVDDSDLAVTDFGELISSGPFCRVLQNTPDAACRPTIWKADSSGRPAMYQLSLSASLGPLAASFPLLREGLCEACGEYRNIGIDAPVFGELRQLRFPVSSYRGSPIALTQEHFGGARKFPLILVSQLLYRQIREERMSGFWFEPAHVIDS